MAVKIDKQVIYKKIVLVVIILGFLSVAENSVSKMVSTKTTSKITQPTIPVVRDNVIQEIIPKNIEKPVFQLLDGKLSLEQIHTLSEGQANEVTRSLKIIPAAQIQSDKFTQSQAHMSLPEIKKLIDAKYNIKPYQKMIDAIIGREVEFKDGYYVFYHGMKNVWYIPQDLYTRLYFHFKKLPADLLQSFVFLRFDGALILSVNVQDFLTKKLKQHGLINDHDLTEMLFSVNLALFGSVGDDPECTWQYFMKARKSIEPDRQIYAKILDTFGLSHKYIDELMKLDRLFNTQEQTIVQMFVPKNEVDQIGYLAWIRGNPAHQKTVDMVLQSLQNKQFEKSPLAMDYYTALFKREQEKNPIFSNLLQRVSAGDFKLNYFLKFYCNYPELIYDINRYQARLIFTPDVLLNPLSGVKILRYSAVKPQQLKEYHKKFDAIFKKIIAEKPLMSEGK